MPCLLGVRVEAGWPPRMNRKRVSLQRLIRMPSFPGTSKWRITDLKGEVGRGEFPCVQKLIGKALRRVGVAFARDDFLGTLVENIEHAHSPPFASFCQHPFDLQLASIHTSGHLHPSILVLLRSPAISQLVSCLTFPHSSAHPQYKTSIRCRALASIGSSRSLLRLRDTDEHLHSSKPLANRYGFQILESSQSGARHHYTGELLYFSYRSLTGTALIHRRPASFHEQSH